MGKKSKMMSKKDAKDFIFKVDMEGLDYAVENYASADTGDEKFNKLVEALRNAQADMDEYIELLRETYNVGVS